MKRIIISILLALAGTGAWAQKMTISTNLLEWMELGTMNVGASAAVARHFSAEGGVRWNPWTFNSNDPQTQLQNRRLSAEVGMRYWPWHIFSGWWIKAKGQYYSYNIGGIWSRETEEGDAFGLGIGAGYTLMLARSFNLDFGLGGWTGSRTWVKYTCPRCGQITDSGAGWFFLPDDAMVSLVYVF